MRTAHILSPVAPDIVQAFVRTIELKDLSTAAHTWRVVLYARALAEHFQLDHDRIASITVGAALHDLGKLDIPDEILQKPARLTEAEFEIIKRHPALGHERLVNMGETDPIVLDLVRHHHEREDGLGYPDKLTTNTISRGAKYFAVIDTFDALTSLRPYRSEIGPKAAEHAFEELHNGIGTRYCQESVEAFTNLYRQGDLQWILEHFNDHAAMGPFCPMQVAKVQRRS